MFTCSDSVMGLERFCDGLAFAKKTTASSHSHSANHAPSAYPWNPHRIRTRTGDTFEGTGGYIIIIYIFRFVLIISRLVCVYHLLALEFECSPITISRWCPAKNVCWFTNPR